MGSATRKIANAFSTSGIISSANINNASLDNITSISGAGDMVFVSSATASSSASIEFSLGSYKEYKFFFVNIHASTHNSHLGFQCSTDGGSTYATTITSACFLTRHQENDTEAQLFYNTSGDLAQSTSFQPLNEQSLTDNDACMGGYMSLFNPSSTTYVKHFMFWTANYQSDPAIRTYQNAGYFNDTNDLTNIKFQMSSGNIDDGKILMFGIN